MRKKKQRKEAPTSALQKAELLALTATPEEMTGIADRAAQAARDAAPGFEVIVVVIQPSNAFRVSWGTMLADRAGWLLFRALRAVEKML